MSILKTKMKIFLVGVIVYQGALYMHKKDNGYDLPNMSQTQNSYGFTSPAYADDNTGAPIDIAYNPYLGEPSSNSSQMQAAAMAHAKNMIQTGDTQAFEQAMQNDPIARHILSFK